MLNLTLKRSALMGAALSSLFGLAGCFGSSSGGFDTLDLAVPDRPGAFRGVTYLCANDRIALRYNAERGRATLNASPTDALKPALPTTQVTGSKVLNFKFLRPVTVTLDAPEGVEEVRLAFAPDDVCANFPAPLVGDFTGTLIQSEPETQHLERRLSFVWEGELLAQLRQADEPFNPQLECTADSADSTVRCKSVAEDFSLEATVTANGLTGRYRGSVQGSASVGPFSGTLDLERDP